MSKNLNNISTMSKLQRNIILFTCAISIFITQVDFTGLNVTLPRIQSELGASTSELQWIGDIYTVVIASLIMLTASLGDKFGRKRVLLIGVSIFGLASLAGALAPNPTWLILARAFQGLGSAMMPAIALAIINNVFLDPGERARAVGVWGTMIGLGAAAGPVIGGLLSWIAGWQGIFWLNVPLSVLGLVAIVISVPESRAAKSRPIDWPGQALMLVGLGSMTYAIIALGEGKTDVLTWALLVAGILALVAFVLVEAIVKFPMVDLKFFRSIPFATAGLLAFLFFFTYAGFMFIATLLLQEPAPGLAFTPLVAGLLMVPLALANAAGSSISGRTLEKTGNRVPLLVGAALQLVLALLLLALPLAGSGDSATAAILALFLVASVLMGASVGLANPALITTALSGMPKDQSGVAGATVSIFRQTGLTIGVAVLGAIMNFGTRARGESIAVAAQPGWWLVALIAIVAALLAIFATTRHALATQQAATASFAGEPSEV